MSAAVARFCYKRLNTARLKHHTMATRTLPEFGGRITDAESNFAGHMTDFSVEMFRCSRHYDGYLQEVKILHISMDLEVVQHETYKIIQYMKDEGFDVKRENYQNPVFREEWTGTNILILGSDDGHSAQAYKLLQLVEAGLLSSVMLGWDVLLYDVSVVSGSRPVKRPAYLPRNTSSDNILWSDRKFSLDGICLIHAHIRRRNDAAALSGLVGDAMTAVESDIDAIMGEDYEKKNRQDLSIYCKIEQFKKKIKQNGGCVSEAELFFAALDVVRKSRNIALHLIQRDARRKKLEAYSGAILRLGQLAKKHKFDDGRGLDCDIPDPSNHNAFFVHFRWLAFLTKISIVWLGEYNYGQEFS